MANIPKGLQFDDLSRYLQLHGLRLLSQGKVRDTYYLDEQTLLVVASDRISVYDFNLNPLIPMKGMSLTVLTHFWLTKVLSHYPNHLVPSKYGPKLNLNANAAYDLKEDFLYELPLERCLVVKNMTGKLYPFEMIFRHHIGGSVYKNYLEAGIAGGHQLPLGLPKWSKLDYPIFTPSTKVDIGNDVNVDADYFFAEMGKKGLEKEARETVDMLTEAYEEAYEYAKERGIIIIDSKFEVAGKMLIDEVLTPDSSRYVSKEDWEQAMDEGREPNFLDKQPVRDWAATVKTPFFDKNGQPIVGINKLNPENEEHVAFVHGVIVPENVISEASERYVRISEMIIGRTLKEYRETEMGCSE